MTRRKKILGLPIGPPQRPRLPGLVAKGAALAVVPTLAGVAVRARNRGAHVPGEAVLERGQQVVDDGRDLARHGKEYAGKAKTVLNTVSDVKEAAAGHSTTVGKVGAALGAAVRQRGGSNRSPRLSHLIEQHTDIAAPRRTVYDQWTQFEMFPRITKGAESVRQQQDDNLQWSSKIGPSRRQWRSRITEQKPDERIAWEADGLSMKGVVTFHRLGDDLTRVLVEIEYHPSGPVEQVGNLLRAQRRRVKRDLRLFKHFVELRHEATGGWRGEIDVRDGREDNVGDGDGSDGNGSGGDRGRSRRPDQASGAAGAGREANGRPQPVGARS